MYTSAVAKNNLGEFDGFSFVLVGFLGSDFRSMLRRWWKILLHR